MMKSTAQAEQFYSRTGSESTKPSRTGSNLLGWGDDYLSSLSPEEQRDSLKRRLVYLQGLRKDGHIGKSIGLEIQEVCLKMNALRPKLKSARASDIPNLFVQVCRDTMTKPEFKKIMDECNRRQRLEMSLDAN